MELKVGPKRIVDRPGTGWAGDRLDLGDDLCPAPTLPDAVVLLATGRPVRPHPRMFEEQIGKGIGGVPKQIALGTPDGCRSTRRR